MAGTVDGDDDTGAGPVGSPMAGPVDDRWLRLQVRYRAERPGLVRLATVPHR